MKTGKKEKTNMTIRMSKKHIARSICALAVVAFIVFGSILTVAAAATTSSNNTEVKSSKEGFVTSSEYILSNGDLLIARNEDFNVTLDVVKANEIIVNNGNDTQTVMLAKGTVADVLKKAQIELADNQVVVPSENTDIVGNMTINIYNGKSVDVTADGETKTVLLPYGNITIDKALNMTGYNVDEDDILSVSRNIKTEDVSAVTIQRVSYGEETSTEKIDFETKYEPSDEVELGAQVTQTKGKKGEKLVTKECKYIDGKKVSEKEIDTKTIKKPVDEVILVGTKGAATSGGAGTFTDMYGNQIAYSQVFTGSGTAYTAPAGAGTATGVKAYHGGVAVNPNIIPYGSKLYVESTDGSFVYGYATAVDTGGALMDGSAIVDCYYATYGECVNFGRRDVNVYVIG